MEGPDIQQPPPLTTLRPDRILPVDMCFRLGAQSVIDVLPDPPIQWRKRPGRRSLRPIGTALGFIVPPESIMRSSTS